MPLGYIALGIYLAIKYKFALLSLDFWSILYIIGFFVSIIYVLVSIFKNIVLWPFHKKIEKKQDDKRFRRIISEENLKEREFHLRRRHEITEKEKELARREKEVALMHKKLYGKKARDARRLAKKTEGQVDFSYLDSKTAPAYNTPASPYYPAEYRRVEGMEADSRFYEQPAIYKSAIDASLLIHEFSDRFVVYREEAGKIKLEKVEYK